MANNLTEPSSSGSFIFLASKEPLMLGFGKFSKERIGQQLGGLGYVLFDCLEPQVKGSEIGSTSLKGQNRSFGFF